MPETFNKVRGLKPRRSRFNLGYSKAFDCDMGQLIPTMIKFMAPGDIFTFTQELVARTKGPLRAPAFADINAYSYNFFVPLRILFGTTKQDSDGWNEWDVNDHDFEKFISGGRTGNDNSIALPRWIPTGNNVVNDNWNGIASGVTGSNADDVNVTVADNGTYSLWDYLEMPVDVIPAGAYPLDFWKRCYNMIYNEWFRDPNVMPPVDITQSNIVLNACWKKDYFTSMLPWQQRGTAQNLPVSLTGNAKVYFSESSYSAFDSSNYPELTLTVSGQTPSSSFTLQGQDGNGNSRYGRVISGSVDLSQVGTSTFTVADLRAAFQIQRWMELNARCTGGRYVEYLKANYGIAPNDDTLHRPMFIGGCKCPIIISEVLQTSADGGEGVGSLSGHSIAASRNYMGRFRANEFGVMMTLTVIRPKAMYHQGIDKENLYDNRYQFLNPAFVNLAEDTVDVAEIYATNNGNVDASGEPVHIGFQGRYNELRGSHDKVCGAMRTTLAYWVSSRTFSSAPVLNGQFLKCNPDKNIFAVIDEPAFVVMIANRITAYRPLPVEAQPGLIDHLYGERR